MSSAKTQLSMKRPLTLFWPSTRSTNVRKMKLTRQFKAVLVLKQLKKIERSQSPRVDVYNLISAKLSMKQIK